MNMNMTYLAIRNLQNTMPRMRYPKTVEECERQIKRLDEAIEIRTFMITCFACAPLFAITFVCIVSIIASIIQYA